MNPQEQRVRDDLAVLAESDRGRELLQLALVSLHPLPLKLFWL